MLNVGLCNVRELREEITALILWTASQCCPFFISQTSSQTLNGNV